MDLSVVIGTYNRLPLLRIAVDSVREELGATDCELFVVDGGSTDGTIDWLVDQTDIISIIQHNRVETNGRPQIKRSWGYFMNLGFKAASARYILMISDDCVLVSGSIEASLEVARAAEAERRALGGVAYYFRNWPDEQKFYVQETLGRRLMVNHGLFLRQALEGINWIDADRYSFYKADGDLSLRLWEAGCEIVASPLSFVEHYVDSEEAQRISNNNVMEADRQAYHERWTHLLDGENRPRKLYLDFRDPADTAERVFRPIRDQIDHMKAEPDWSSDQRDMNRPAGKRM